MLYVPLRIRSEGNSDIFRCYYIMYKEKSFMAYFKDVTILQT